MGIIVEFPKIFQPRDPMFDILVEEIPTLEAIPIEEVPTNDD